MPYKAWAKIPGEGVGGGLSPKSKRNTLQDVKKNTITSAKNE